MMEGNPSWWSMHSKLGSTTSNDHQQQSLGVSSNMLLSQTHPSLMSTIHYPYDHHHQGQHFPHSWSQLLLGGLGREEEERYGLNLFQTTKGMSEINLDEDDHVKQEEACNNLIGYHQNYEEQEVGVGNREVAWSQNMPTSSPRSSCVTSLSSTNNNDNSNSNTMLDFSTSKRSLHEDSSQHVDHSNFECNSSSNFAEGVSNKKTKVQSLPTPTLKVRKEKLGDRITSLHQLVSPFGKTDTASVLLEAIGYIRFLQGQIQALTSPYLGSNNASAKNQHSIHGEGNCLFPDHPGQEYKDTIKLDLKSRGLCLVPLSCTHITGSDNGADYWAPTFGGGGF